jgi:hypothetical protein
VKVDVQFGSDKTSRSVRTNKISRTRTEKAARCYSKARLQVVSAEVAVLAVVVDEVVHSVAVVDTCQDVELKMKRTNEISIVTQEAIKRNVALYLVLLLLLFCVFQCFGLLLSGVKSVEKRNGAGMNNWGTIEDEQAAIV